MHQINAAVHCNTPKPLLRLTSIAITLEGFAAAIIVRIPLSGQVQADDYVLLYIRQYSGKFQKIL